MTVYSKRLGAELYLGKRDAAPPPAGAVHLRDLLTGIAPSTLSQLTAAAALGELPQLPAAGWGWGYDLGPAGWGMDGNGPAAPGSKIPSSWAAAQGAGDCWWAMMAHRIRELAKNSGRPIPPISDLTVIKQYAAYSGYDPQTGAGDTGTDPQGAYQYLEQHPFTDDNGVPYPQAQVINLTAGNVQEHLIACVLFQNVGVGVQLQSANVDQFDEGQPLAYAPGSPVEGGHELLLAGPHGMIEWGSRIGWVPSFIEQSNDESQATLSNEMYNAVTGETVNDYTQQDLEKYAVLLTQQSTS